MEWTHKGVNLRSKDGTQAQQTNTWVAYGISHDKGNYKLIMT